jgi:hypothetical protein
MTAVGQSRQFDWFRLVQDVCCPLLATSSVLHSLHPRHPPLAQDRRGRGHGAAARRACGALLPLREPDRGSAPVSGARPVGRIDVRYREPAPNRRSDSLSGARGCARRCLFHGNRQSQNGAEEVKKCERSALDPGEGWG